MHNIRPLYRKFGKTKNILCVFGKIFSGEQFRNSSPFLEDEEGRDNDEEETGEVIPVKRFTELEVREAGKNGQRDDLLDRLQLRRARDAIADPVQRHLQTLIEEGDTPRDEDDDQQRLV